MKINGHQQLTLFGDKLPAPQIEIELPLRGRGEYGVTNQMIHELEPLYPAVDVAQTLREMKGWLLGNPERRKTRRGMMRFVTRWLKEEQDKHGAQLILATKLGQCMWNLNGSRGSAPRCETGAVEERDGLRYCKAHLHAFGERVR